MSGSQQRWRDADISLVDYDPTWPAMFADEAALLAEAIGPWATGGIHHVGSTAVPGLANRVSWSSRTPQPYRRMGSTCQ